jgi:hypothetical protein
MSEVTAFNAPPVKPAPPEEVEDLSEEIIRAVEKRPEDRVMCRRIWGNSYRCNWWSVADASNYDNPAMGGNLVTTHTIRMSRFLNVTRSRLGLVITEQDGRTAN